MMGYGVFNPRARRRWGYAERITSNWTISNGVEVEFNSFTGSDSSISMDSDGEFTLPSGMWFMFATLNSEHAGDEDRYDQTWFETGGSALTTSNVGRVMAVSRDVDEQAGTTLPVAFLEVADGGTTTVELRVTSVGGSGYVAANYACAVFMEL